ncbi:hypothetical protein [Nonomuraea jabiensis]|uniref:hypothetical protein n=1 Tax=Nonomuraea jabiensis TaxID=882448 RepID=UPI003674CF95
MRVLHGLTAPDLEELQLELALILALHEEAERGSAAAWGSGGSEATRAEEGGGIQGDRARLTE